MRKKTLTYLISLLCYGAAQAQNITVNGYISEKKSAERLIGATVFVPAKSIGTASNSFGFYSITLPATNDSVELRVSYIGYTPYTIKLAGNRDHTLNIEMAATQNLDEVVITSQKDALQTRTQMSSIDLPVSTIKSLPAFLGEVDILKAIQLLPGVQGGNEGTSGLYVRGGGPDQNLILLDGVPVYNASHMFGFFSVFNADAVKSVEVIKGGFPARYGGRLSSVIDINMKEGDKNEFHGEGGIGIVASRLTLEGPIQKGKSSFMVSGRRTYVDVLAAPLMATSNTKAGYYFYDLNGKANIQLGKKDHLYVSGYLGNDKFYTKEKDGIVYDFRNSLQWGNITAVGRWNHEFSRKLFGNLTTYYSQYKFQISSVEKSNYGGFTEDFLLKYSSGIFDKTVKYDFDFLPSPNHYIKAGAGIVAHTYTPGALQTRLTDQNIDTTLGNERTDANEIDAYIEDDIRIGSRFKTNIGIHWTGFAVNGQFYTGLQPRVAMRYLLSDDISLKASYVQMNQFIHLLTNSSVGLPTDLWVPVTEKVPAQKSQQGAAGIAYTHRNGMEISVEGYYKTMDNVIEYKEGASFFNTIDSWQDKVEIGKGRSYGAELFVQKKKGRFTGMLSYTLSWSKRQFDNLNGGKEYPYRYDRRHDIKVAGIFNINKNIELSADWVYGTGNAITLPIGVYQGPNGNDITVYGDRNGFRMPAYHRGDVSIKFTKQKKRWQRSWIISAYNVYDRRNAFYIYTDTDNAGYTQFKQISLFPVIPSISYQFKF